MISSPSQLIFLIFFKQTKHTVIFIHLEKMSVLNQSCYCLSCISCFILWIQILMLICLDHVITVYEGKLILSLYSYDGLSMIFHQRVCNLLSDIRKQHIAAMPPWNIVAIDLRTTAHRFLPHWCKCCTFGILLVNSHVCLKWSHHSFDTVEQYILDFDDTL